MISLPKNYPLLHQMNRALVLVAITYIPLLLLSFAQDLALPSSGLNFIPFLFDVAEASRFLIVGPLLLISQSIIDPWLAQVVTYIKQRLIRPEDTDSYELTILRMSRLQEGLWIQLLLFLATFLWQSIDATFGYWPSNNTWQELPGSHTHSYAWFCYAYFAKPLVRFLWLRWLWRYLVWLWFIFVVSRLNLKIMPTHPDRAGGLGVILVGHSKYALLAFTLAIQASSILANQIIFHSKTLWAFRYEILGVVVLVLFVFLLPFVVFSPGLLQAKRIGLFEYSALADDYISRFRRKWIEHGEPVDELLGSSDIQSLADLDNSFNIVREMKTCLITKTNFSIFASASLLPFAPLLLSVYPFDDLLKHLLKVLM